MAVFQSNVFFNVSLRTYAQYAPMNEFTCSEHSVRIVGRKNAALEINPCGRSVKTCIQCIHTRQKIGFDHILQI